jgi:hypothetical protein
VGRTASHCSSCYGIGEMAIWLSCTPSGALVFEHACRLGLEGIVSKRKDSQYRSGRSPHWIKSKNPNAPAVKREAEKEWGRWPSRRATGRNDL